MKKFIYLFILALGFTSCSVESIDSTENLLMADMKIKIQQVEKSMTLKAEEICEGDAPVFVFNFPQDTKGNGDPKDTDVHIQLHNSDIDVWESFKKLSYAGAGPEEYTFEDEVLAKGTYSFRASIGSGGFDYYATLDVVECGCDESFSYVDHGDGTYTFTYKAEEDMDNAELTMTFPQANVEAPEGWHNNDKGNSSAWKNSINLEACSTYNWTFTLTSDCNNIGQNVANLWTDFNVGEDSKKNYATPNIQKSCN